MMRMKFSTLASALMWSFMPPAPTAPVAMGTAADMRRHKRKGGPAHTVSTGVRAAKRTAAKRRNIQRNKSHH